jgi:two-component system, cell cycle response regulator CtrA
LAPEGITGDVAEFDDVGSVAQHSGPYDAVLLDVQHAHDGLYAALRDLRRRGLRMPALVVARGLTAEEESEALHLGADDVLVRGTMPGVIAARLRAVQRRTLGHVSSRLACGNAVLDQARRTITVDDRPVRVTRREFEVMEMLMLRRGMVLSKEHFMNCLYGGEEAPDQRILDVFVCKLRRKLAAAGAAEMIMTAWGHGYMLQDPSPVAVAAARARHAAGKPRRHRAHLTAGLEFSLAS